MRAIRALFVIVGAAAAASCTEANPNACANDPGVCATNTMCVQGQDSNGQGWSRCVPVTEGDARGVGDDAIPPTADAASSGAVASFDRLPPDAREGGVDVGAQVIMPDALAADAPPADGLAPDAGAGDAPITCSNQCGIGSRRCGNGGGTQECVMVGACTVWAAEVACAAPRMCQASGLSASCTCPNFCNQGSQQCGPGGGLQACSVGPAGCPIWSGESACQSPKTCQQSGSTASCACSSPAECALGASQCGPGGGVRSCSMVNDCPAWGAETPCATPRTCQQNGATASCGCPSTCTLGETKCGAQNVQECVMQNGCPAWGAERTCPTVCRQSGSTASCCGDSVRTGDERCDGGGSSSTDLGACNPECTGFFERKTIKRTTGRFTGSLGGPAGADQGCVAEFGSGWKALLVGGGRRATVTPNRGDGQADWVIAKYTHYYNELGQLLWRSDGVALLGVRDGQRVNIYADAFPSDGTYPWGGYGSDWVTKPEGTGPDGLSGTCRGWTSAVHEDQGTFPLWDLREAATEPCAAQAPLLCVEQ